MIHVIAQWRITIDFEEPNKNIEFLIHDDHYTNMLRKLAELSFDIKYRVNRIIIERNNAT